jgi:ribosome maturation factor RimP
MVPWNGIDEVGRRPAFFVICSAFFRARSGGWERVTSAVQLEQRNEEIIEPAALDLGFEVVRVQLSGDHNPRLQIMAEPIEGDIMTVDHCAKISRAVSAILDVDDPIDGAYTLEVSSPGLDRPLVKLRDFARFAGFDARIETTVSVDGRKRFRGRLAGVDGETIMISVDGDDMAIDFADVRRAKLLVTDEMLAAQEDKES